eukprot:GILJ01009203.1.p1 GENE.GILJ01009203.1~~GILJ01009203.1.p1  ORF type:complete len:735 (+),score=51.90 GILJ01009203.1:104-2308(+)
MNTSHVEMTRQYVREQVTPFWLTFRDAELERKFHTHTRDQLLEWKEVYDLVLLILLGIYFAAGMLSGSLPTIVEIFLTLGFACIYRLLFIRAPRWRLSVAVGWFIGCLLLVILFTLHSGRMLAGIVLFHHVRIVGGVTVFRRWMPYSFFSCLCEVTFFVIFFFKHGRVGYLEEPAYLAALCYGCVLAHVMETQQRTNFLLVTMLGEHQRHWQQFTEVSPDGVVVYGSNNTVLYHNEAATPLLESRILQAVDGFEVTNANPLPPSQLFEHMTAKCTSSQPVEFSCVSRTQKDQYLRLSVVAMPYLWRGADTTLFIFRDTTARLDLDILRRASSSRTLLWASLSHNLRTPLNGIQAAVGHLNKNISSPEDLEMLGLLRSSADLLSTFMSDILDYVSIEFDQLNLKIVSFDVVELLNDCVRIARDTDIARHVDLRLELLCDFTPTFRGDSTRIKQVVMNLLCNALRYTRQGFVIVRGHIANNTLKVEVQDSGIGVPKHLKHLIFDWLEQATSSGEMLRTEETVCGFGLPISKALCRYMNGKIGVHSDAGVGSTFWFTVPEQTVGEDAPVPLEMLKNGCRKSLLIVDDNEFNRVVIKSMLKGTDLLLAEAENGAQAVEQYRNQAFDIILMDISMPIMDGLQATEEIRRYETSENKNPCVIVAITAFVGKHQEIECLARGMNACLGKPVAKNDLLDSIKEAMHQLDRNVLDEDEGTVLGDHLSREPSPVASRRPFQVSS